MSSFVCPICRDFLTEPQDAEALVRREEYHPVAIYCGHIFHTHCLNKWMENCDLNNVKYVCPSCQREILNQDIVRIYLSRQDNVDDYQTMVAKDNQQNWQIRFQTFEAQRKTEELEATKNKCYVKQEKLDEQNEALQHLQNIIDFPQNPELSSEGQKELLESELRSAYEKLKNCQERLRDITRITQNSQVFFKCIRMAIEDGNILKKSAFEAKSVKKGPRKTKTADAFNKIRNMLTNSPNCVDQLTSGKEKLNNVSVEKSPYVFFQTSTVGSPLSSGEKKTMSAYLRQCGPNMSPEKQPEIVLYLPRARVFFPSLELFQLQLATILRITQLTHTREIIETEEMEKVPLMKIGGQDIHEAEICSALIKEITYLKYCNQEKKDMYKTITLLNVLRTKIFWGILLWQWSFNNGQSMTICPKTDFTTSSLAVKLKVEEMALEESFGYLDVSRVVEIVVESIRTLSKELDKCVFFSGNYPAEIDVCAFVLLIQILWNTPGSPFQEELIKHPNLLFFIFNMKHRFWPDWAIGASLPRFWIR